MELQDLIKQIDRNPENYSVLDEDGKLLPEGECYNIWREAMGL